MAKFRTLEHFVFFIQACFLGACSRSDAASCNPSQAVSCQNAALGNSLGRLSEGGTCERKTYVDYTHVCSVTNYLPSADYCCCVDDHRVYCCRYHYIWDKFRCDSEDIIDALPGSSSSGELPLALEILIPVIVLPSLVILCFVFYCIKCCCCSDDDEGRATYRKMFCCKRHHSYQDKSVQIEEPGVGLESHYAASLLQKADTSKPVYVPSRAEPSGGAGGPDDAYYSAHGHLPAKPPEYSILPYYMSPRSDSGIGSEARTTSQSSDSTTGGGGATAQPSAPPLEKDSNYGESQEYSGLPRYVDAVRMPGLSVHGEPIMSAGDDHYRPQSMLGHWEYHVHPSTPPHSTFLAEQRSLDSMSSTNLDDDR